MSQNKHIMERDMANLRRRPAGSFSTFLPVSGIEEICTPPVSLFGDILRETLFWLGCVHLCSPAIHILPLF